MDSNVLAVIPARSGSKGLRHKNILPVAGLPLIAHSILCARLTESIDKTIVSTDSPFYRRVARKYGADVPQLRPESLAGDEAGMWPTLQLAVETAEDDETYTDVILLQPTNPARIPTDLEKGLARLTEHSTADGVIGTSRADFHIRWQAVTDDSGFIKPLFNEGSKATRRQDVEAEGYINGLLYIFKRAHIDADGPLDGQLLNLEVPETRSIDIDSEEQYDEARVKIESGFVDLPWVRTNGYERDRNGADSVLNIDETFIGPELPTFIIAEAGVNHNGDPQKAYKLIDAASEAGADAVKFQTFIPDKLASSHAEKADYQKEQTDDSSQKEMLEKLSLPLETFEKLKAYAEERGLIFLSTPFEDQSANTLDDIGLSAFKVGSGDLTNLPLLKQIARFGKPMLVSTGMATISEIEAAVDTIEQKGSPPLALLHCVSSYPTEHVDANLRAIETLEKRFDLPVGWSDHTLGTSVSVAAASMGAALIEKHFTLDKTLPGPDHQASLEPDELQRMVEQIREIEKVRGHGSKTPTAGERQTARTTRKSLFAARDIRKGERLERGDIEILRPPKGLAPSRLESVVGTEATQAIAKGEPFTEKHLGET